MSNVAKDKRKSNFTSQSTIPSGAYFDFVYNNVNYKIPVADMISVFGTTGTIEQQGDPAQTTILDKDGTTNYIRNLEDGPGVKASVSLQGGAQLEHSFTTDSTGAELVVDLAANEPEFRSLVAGSGVTIAEDGSVIRISGTDLPVSSNIVIVNEMSDFPAAVSGVITLSDSTAYLVSNQLTTGNRFVMGDNTIVYGADSNVSALIYTGTDAMFTSVDKSSKITLLLLSAASGSLFDVSDSTGITTFQLINSTVLACDTIGTLDTIGAIQVTDVAFINTITNGMSFVGNIGVFVGTRNVFTIQAGSIFDLGTAVFTNGFSLETSFVTLNGSSVFMSGAIDSGNIGASTSGTVFNTRISGAGTPLSGVDETDARWNFLTNDEIKDSKSELLSYNNGLTITIATIDTPVKIGATWVTEQASRFTGSSDGTFTYTGTGDFLTLTATISAIGVVSQARDFTFYFYKNGTQITESGVQRSFASSASGSVSLLWGVELETDDYIEIFVENNETTNNLDILKAIMRPH